MDCFILDLFNKFDLVSGKGIDIYKVILRVVFKKGFVMFGYNYMGLGNLLE